ncbi:Hsp20/alpha crystallin family protein [Saccharicrinis carchari]|uniref:Hsp20/alpha crystallin family protein n=1 Tax=Saccharicrinis carchari TaxID=1168039 RepID=A0A521F4B1_SACCC|nr:Hsp20 family protein [Saccharicrinis carchari]SMO91017.1 Hsp20/alpha crystallin family protein [Saccharicrinis carchari]
MIKYDLHTGMWFCPFSKWTWEEKKGIKIPIEEYISQNPDTCKFEYIVSNIADEDISIEITSNEILLRAQSEIIKDVEPAKEGIPSFLFRKKIVISDDMDLDKMVFEHKKKSLALVIPRKDSPDNCTFTTSFKEPYYG